MDARGYTPVPLTIHFTLLLLQTQNKTEMQTKIRNRFLSHVSLHLFVCLFFCLCVCVCVYCCYFFLFCLLLCFSLVNFCTKRIRNNRTRKMAERREGGIFNPGNFHRNRTTLESGRNNRSNFTSSCFDFRFGLAI